MFHVQVLRRVDACWLVLQDQGQSVQVEVLAEATPEGQGCEAEESWVSLILFLKIRVAPITLPQLQLKCFVNMIFLPPRPPPSIVVSIGLTFIV